MTSAGALAQHLQQQHQLERGILELSPLISQTKSGTSNQLNNFFLSFTTPYHIMESFNLINLSSHFPPAGDEEELVVGWQEKLFSQVQEHKLQFYINSNFSLTD